MPWVYKLWLNNRPPPNLYGLRWWAFIPSDLGSAEPFWSGWLGQGQDGLRQPCYTSWLHGSFVLVPLEILGAQSFTWWQEAVLKYFVPCFMFVFGPLARASHRAKPELHVVTGRWVRAGTFSDHIWLAFQGFPHGQGELLISKPCIHVTASTTGERVAPPPRPFKEGKTRQTSLWGLPRVQLKIRGCVAMKNRSWDIGGPSSPDNKNVIG